MYGASGYVADTSLSPFVIGLIPVVGAGGLAPWVGRVPGIGVPMPTWGPVPGTSKVERFLADGGSICASMSVWESGSAAGPAAALPGGLPAPAGGGSRSGRPTLSVPEAKPLGGTGTGEDESREQLRQAQQSTAGQAALSVAEARALRQAEVQQANQEALEFFHRGQQAEQAGKTSVALAYYRMAAQRATGDLKHQILARLANIKSASSTR